jgi:hypothetical protein
MGGSMNHFMFNLQSRIVKSRPYRIARNYVEELTDEWFGIYGGHGHLKKLELFEALFDAFAGAYLTYKFQMGALRERRRVALLRSSEIQTGRFP